MLRLITYKIAKKCFFDYAKFHNYNQLLCGNMLYKLIKSLILFMCYTIIEGLSIKTTLILPNFSKVSSANIIIIVAT